MAWWNFSERTLLDSPSGYSVNHYDTPLVFFHFSGFRPEKSFLTERLISEEFQVAKNEILARLYEDYKKSLLDNSYEYLSKIKPGLSFKEVPNSSWNKLGRKLKSKMVNAIYHVFKV